MARRHRRARASALRNDHLSIRFEGPPGSGKTTVLQAVRLLLEDAGYSVDAGIAGGANHDGSLNLLTIRPDKGALAELGAWMAEEPS